MRLIWSLGIARLPNRFEGGADPGPECDRKCSRRHPVHAARRGFKPASTVIAQDGDRALQRHLQALSYRSADQRAASAWRPKGRGRPCRGQGSPRRCRRGHGGEAGRSTGRQAAGPIPACRDTTQRAASRTAVSSADSSRTTTSGGSCSAARCSIAIRRDRWTVRSRARSAASICGGHRTPSAAACERGSLPSLRRWTDASEVSRGPVEAPSPHGQAFRPLQADSRRGTLEKFRDVSPRSASFPRSDDVQRDPLDNGVCVAELASDERPRRSLIDPGCGQTASPGAAGDVDAREATPAVRVTRGPERLSRPEANRGPRIDQPLGQFLGRRGLPAEVPDRRGSAGAASSFRRTR